MAVPSSTYRLQLGPSLTFAGAQALAPYLASLGVGAVYLSPCLRARPGSSHGYDVVDYDVLNPELGGAAGFEAMARTFRDRRMGVIVDFVPNHMSVDPVENRSWRAVLEHGPSAQTAEWFDIDWRPAKTTLQDKVLLPILGDQYGAVLERGEIRVAFVGGEFEVQYFEHRLPLNPSLVPLLFEPALSSEGASDADPHDMRELASIVAAFGGLPPYTSLEPHQRKLRPVEARRAYERLRLLLSRSPTVAAAIERALDAINGERGRPRSFDRLHALLECQPYRLAYWRTAFDEINYRRFFDINELAAVRMEDRHVFDRAHRLVLDLIGRQLITGLRIDHPDGLADPETYFEQLQEAASLQAPARAVDLGDPLQPPFYVLAEKILSEGERFPPGWAIHGGTGYLFLNHVNGLFIDPAGLQHLGRFWSRLTSRSVAFDEIAYECRRLVAETAMASEMNVLAHALEDMAVGDRRTRDFTLNSLRRVLRDVVASFPVYRTYVSGRGASDADRAIIRQAVAEARRRSSIMERSIFDFVERALTANLAAEGGDASLRFAVRAQQITGPIQAKGLEDTAFYRYVPLLASNDVGSHPSNPTLSVEEFHETNLSRLTEWPATMTTLATHDTKRSGDARARLAVLSEHAAEWRRAAAAWSRLNTRHRVVVGDTTAPARPDEYHLYQALVAIWPPEANDAPIPSAAPDTLVDRLSTYAVKAVREAKERSSWLWPNQPYEDAVVAFVRAIMQGVGGRRFLARFVPFARRVARPGAVNALAQVVLQMASPGVPDVYQGAEDWHFRLVDPDNRGPVDFAARSERLNALHPWLARAAAPTPDPELAAFAEDLLEHWADGRVKTWVAATGLRRRQADPALFLAGAYVPVVPDPADAPLVAFARVTGDREILVIVPRLFSRLTREGSWPIGEVWADVGLRLPAAVSGHVWHDRLTGRRLVADPDTGNGRRIQLARALSTLPVAWLERIE